MDLAREPSNLCRGRLNQKLFEEIRESILNANPSWESYMAKYYVGFRSGKRKLHAVLEGRTSNGGWIAVGLAKSVDELIDRRPCVRTSAHRVDLGRVCRPMLHSVALTIFRRCSIL